MQNTKPSRSKTYHHGDLKNALVEAAAKLVSERGAASVSLREVARVAGVSHAAPYHHFKDKAGLTAAVAEEGFRRFDQYQQRALRNASSDPKERLAALGKSYIRFAIANPHFFRVMFRGDFTEFEQYSSLSTLGEQTFDRLVNTVRENVKTSNEPEIMIAALRAWALVHGLATLWLDGGLNKIRVDQKTLYSVVDQFTRSL
jgi:AcrR family transcriptional regulator